MKTLIQALFGQMIKKIPQVIKGLLTLLFSLPALAMAFFVKHQNKRRSFVQQYAWVWFVALACWMSLTVYCYKIDYEVLYALKYSSSHNATTSWQEAAFNAAVIQFLLLFCGGGFFKNLIFTDFVKSINYPPKTKEKPHPLPVIRFSSSHSLQLIVLGALFAYGFYWTLTLSQKTGALARVEAQSNVDQIAQTYEEKSSSLATNYVDEVANYRADAQEQTKSINSNYEDRIENLNKKYEAIIGGYEARYKQGSITKSHLQKRSTGYQRAKEKAIAPLLKERAEKIEAIQANLTSQLQRADGLHQDSKRAIDHQNSSARVTVNKQIQETAQTTQGRNVQYNFLNQILWMALLIFAKSARSSRPAPTPDESASKKRESEGSHTSKRETSTAEERTHTTVENNLHNTTQAGGWSKIRWPRLGEDALMLSTHGYHVRITTRTVWVEYGNKFHSISTVKSWAKQYENRGQVESEKYKEYCRMIEVLELMIRDLDAQERLQAAG